jgi:hypothetical protein
MTVFVDTPASKVLQVKTAISVARTDTTARALMALPKGAIVLGISLQADTASDAATTATVSVGTTTTATEWVNSQDVKSAAGVITPTLASGVLNTVLTADTILYGKYAETGTASTVGGPWYLKVEYVLTGPGKI